MSNTIFFGIIGLIIVLMAVVIVLLITLLITLRKRPGVEPATMTQLTSKVATSEQKFAPEARAQTQKEKDQSESKTTLATTKISCPNCSAAIPNDAIFCAKCGSAVSLQETTDTTDLIHIPVAPTRLKDPAISNTQVVTTVKRTCPFCHTTEQRESEDRFCGKCGSMLI